VDEFRLSDLASEETRGQTRPSAPAKSGSTPSAGDTTTTSSARSPKDKM